MQLYNAITFIWHPKIGHVVKITMTIVFLKFVVQSLNLKQAGALY